MSVITTYRSYVAKLVAGVDFLTGRLGSGYAGIMALLTDCLAQGATFAIESRLPGHPNQWRDALAQQGSDAGLFRYRNETDSSWAARVANPWPNYEQAGTAPQLLRAINEWGYIVFPLTWDSTKVHLTESMPDRVTIWLDAGLTDWQPARKWGDGVKWGSFLYGISNAKTEDIATLRRIVIKWKRGISKVRGCIVLSGHVWGQPGLQWGGFVYEDNADRILLDF